MDRVKGFLIAGESRINGVFKEKGNLVVREEKNL